MLMSRFAWCFYCICLRQSLWSRHQGDFSQILRYIHELESIFLRGWYKTLWSLRNLLVFILIVVKVSVQGVKSLGSHFACLCHVFEFYEVKKEFFFVLFLKKNGNTFTLLIIFIVKSRVSVTNSSEKSSKKTKQHKSTTITLPE